MWNADNRGNYWSDYRGFDENSDGLGDTPYKSEKLFEDIIDRNKTLRIFIYSPVTKAIELASEAFPVIKPLPKLTDKRPLIKPVVPLYMEKEKKSGSVVLLLFSLFLILVPILFYFNLIRQKDTGIC